MEYADYNYLPTLNDSNWSRTGYSLINSSEGYCIKAEQSDTSNICYQAIDFPFTVMDTGSGYVASIKFVDSFSIVQSGTQVSRLLDTKAYTYASLNIRYSKTESGEEIFSDDTHYIPYTQHPDDTPRTINVNPGAQQYSVNAYSAEREIPLRDNYVPVHITIQIMSIKAGAGRTYTMHAFRPQLLRSKTTVEQIGGGFSDVTGVSLNNSGITGYYMDDDNEAIESFGLRAGTGAASFTALTLSPIRFKGDPDWEESEPTYGGRLEIHTTGKTYSGGSHLWPKEGILFDNYAETGGSFGYSAYINVKQETLSASPELLLYSRGNITLKAGVSGDGTITVDGDLDVSGSISGASLRVSHLRPSIISFDSSASINLYRIQRDSTAMGIGFYQGASQGQGPLTTLKGLRFSYVLDPINSWNRLVTISTPNAKIDFSSATGIEWGQWAPVAVLG